MIATLKKILSREGGREYVQPSKEEKADFLLRVREHTGRTLDVGRLSLRKGTWHFEYTEDFRHPNEYPSHRELSASSTSTTNPIRCGRFS